MKEGAKEIIGYLLRVLPDSYREENDCWDWAWNELDDEAQEEVKRVRKIAEEYLESQVERVPR